MQSGTGTNLLQVQYDGRSRESIAGWRVRVTARKSQSAILHGKITP
jgi:hypothetical protein